MEPTLPLLSLSIFIPLLSALYIALCVGNKAIDNKEQHSIYIAILSSTLTFITTIMLLIGFNGEKSGFQFIEQYEWISAIGLDFALGVDGLSIYFIFLTSFLTLICIIASLFTIHKKIKEFLVCFLLLEAFAIGSFASLNLLLFYIFFEVVLVPMYLIIGIWGAENRIYAALKFFLYTFFGSIFLLLAIIYIYIKLGTFSIIELSTALPQLSDTKQQILCAAILCAMAIKVPMVPFHTWLPDAHVQAPTTGSVILAGILLKLGGYGILRLVLPMFPKAVIVFAPYLVAISVGAIIYASLLALSQTDMKKMIAYSSIAHMGYVTGGIFSFSFSGINGAIFQMISHGVISSALFLSIGILYERGHSKEIAKYGGLVSKMPIFTVCFMISVLGSIGLPGLSGFIGEFLTIIGIFSYNKIYGAIAAFGVVLGALYMLRLYRDLALGEVSSKVSEFSDVNRLELITLVPLAALIIVLGVAPNIVLGITDSSLSMIANIYKF